MENRTVILANGDFPQKGGAAWKLLAAAKRVVCCDGAADAYRRRFRKWPAVVIGDFDSVRAANLRTVATSATGAGKRVGCYRASRRGGDGTDEDFATVVHVPDQNTNDLEKAMSYCAKRKWHAPVIVGATGKREDHTLGNVFRALEYRCEIVTDRGRFVPVLGKATLKTAKGAAVSVFAPDPKTRMTSNGLVWPLDAVKFKNLYCATLNRATSSRVTLTTTKPVSVYIES